MAVSGTEEKTEGVLGSGLTRPFGRHLKLSGIDSTYLR